MRNAPGLSDMRAFVSIWPCRFSALTVDNEDVESNIKSTMWVQETEKRVN